VALGDRSVFDFVAARRRPWKVLMNEVIGRVAPNTQGSKNLCYPAPVTY